jgi:hypothetical protein
MEGDGVWVRCTRCQNVFFQPRLADHKLGESPEIPSVRISDSKRVPDGRLQPENGNLDKEPVVNFEKESLPVTADKDDNSLLSTPTEVAKEEQPREHAKKPPQQPPTGRHWGRIIFASIALIVFIAITAGAVVWALYPDIRDSMLKNVSPYLRGITIMENILPAEKVDVKAPFETVKIKDLRQRTVTNIITGNLRIIEGTAVNQAPYPVSGIKVRLVITDPNDAVLGQKVAYCGNILTDEELGAMTEADIQRELSIPEGSDFPGGHILPNGEIPFMIVFTHDQTAGAIKTSVTIAGADRAL